MGLRCLLSHDFGEPELEREREEQGNEVIITVNEVKTCSRCGERRLVSENTEVTSMEQLTKTASDQTVSQPPADDGQPAEAPPAATGEPTSTASDMGITIDESAAVTDDAEVLTDDSDDGPEDLGAAEPANMTVDDVEAAAAESVQSVDDVEAAAAESVQPVDESIQSADDDDGVILTNAPDPEDEAEPDAEADPEREPGEWPEYESGDEPTEDERSWPDVEGDDEGFSAEDPADEEPENITFGGGFTPEITESEAATNGEESQLSFTRAKESTVEYEPTVDDIQTEFFCPECGLSRLSGNSSMRAGDICPECKRGYISEQPTEQ